MSKTKSHRHSCTEASNEFVSENLTKSKLPRWCGNKVPLINDPLECCFGIPDSSLFPSDGTVNSVCQPPSLTETELKAVWALESLRKEADDRVKQTLGHTDYLKDRLRDVKREIEVISSKLESAYVDKTQVNSTEEERHNALVEFAKENLRLQRDLIECVDLEKKFTDELAQAQRDQWTAVTNKEFLIVEEEKVKPTLSYYQKQQAYKVQKRSINEKRLRQNALKIRNRTLNTVVNTLQTSYVTHKHKVESARSTKLQTAKISRWKLQAHLKKTMGSRHELKLHEACNQQLVQDRQYRMLSRLKKEIESQRSHLLAVHQEKERKKAEEVIKDQAVYEYIEKTGTNPYVVERLVAMEKRFNEQRKKIIDKEHKRLAELHRDFEIIEKSTQRDEMRKKKWEMIWAKRFEEKKKAVLAKKMEFLYSGPVLVEEPIPIPEDTEEVKIEEIPQPPEPLLPAEEEIPDVASSKPARKSRKGKKKRTPRNSKSGILVEPTAPVSSTVSEDNQTVHLESGSRKRKKQDSQEKRLSLTERKSSESIEGEEEEGGEDYFVESTIANETIGEYGDHRRSLKFNEVATILPFVPSALLVPLTNQAKRKTVKFRFKPKPKPKPKGPCFKWIPETIIFSDYEVGKTYRQTVTVTNISIQRMKFCMKELFDDVDYSEPNDLPKLQDMIRVKFGVSKLFSPGLHHELVLLFTPKVMADYKGTMYFQSNEEPFQMRIECWQKRFRPTLSATQVVFKDTISHTVCVLPIIIKNAGSKRGVISRIFHTVAPIYEEGVFLTENEEEEEEETMIEMYAPNSPTSVQVDKPKNTRQSTPRTTPRSSKYKKSLKNESRLNNKAPIGDELKSRLSKSAKTLNPTETKSKKKFGRSSRKDKKNSQPKKGSKKSSSEINNIVVTPEYTTADATALLNEIIFMVTENIFTAYVKECNRKLDKDKSRTICILFRPPYVGSFKTSFEIEFEDKTVPKMTFEVVGDSIPNPITIDPANTDMRICFMDHNYQQMLSVTTTSKGAGKAIPVVPQELKQFVKVVPSQATLLPKSPATFCVKFQPTIKMMDPENPVSKYFDRDTQLIDFPVLFQLKFPYKMDSPLTTTFLAVVTDHQLELFPEELDMGKCCSNESVLAPFTVFNNSLLPQHIGFTDYPEFITIQPNFGFATLLPFEKKEFQVVLSLPEGIEGNVTYNLKCQSREDKQIVLKVKVNAKVNHIHFSHSRISFPVTPIETTTSAAIEIFSNAGPDLYHGGNPPKTKFQFLQPIDSPIEILPNAGYITWDQSQKLLVRFHPTVNDEQVKLHALEMLANQYIHTHALLQRELDGINHTLNHMVGGEDDIQNEMLGEGHDHLMPRKSLDNGMSSHTRLGSFVRPAPAPSDIIIDVQNKRPSLPLPKKSLVEVKEKKSGKKSSKSKIHSHGKDDNSSIASSKGSGDGKRRRSSQVNPVTPVNVVSEEQKVLRTLHARMNELVKLLAQPYQPPSIDDIGLGTKEFVKAKRDYVKKFQTISCAYRIPCFITHPNNETDILMLCCRCPVSQPSFVLMEESLVDFESIVLGARAHKELHFHNITQGSLKIRPDILDPDGPFTHCNACRKIPPDHVYTLRLRFKPNSIDPVTETLRVSLGNSKTFITLQGESEVPNFTITPVGDDFYLGDIHVEHYHFQEFSITNANKGRLKFSLKLVDHGECDISTTEGLRKSAYFTEEFMHAATDRRNSMEDEELKIPVAAPPTSSSPLPEIMPKTQSKRGSRRSRGSGQSNVSEFKKSRRGTAESKYHGTTKLSSIETSPPEPEMTFEIETEGKKLTLNTKDLVQHLNEKNENYYFCSIPPVLPIPGGKTRVFRVYFVPSRSGKYYAHFEIKLEDKTIQEFTVYGDAHKKVPKPVPENEDETLPE